MPPYHVLVSWASAAGVSSWLSGAAAWPSLQRLGCVNPCPLVREQGVDHGVGSTEMLYYNSATSLPLLLVLVVLLGEAHALPAAYAKVGERSRHGRTSP